AVFKQAIELRRRCGARAAIDRGPVLPQNHFGRRSMSSPLDRDFGPDEPSPYAPKWVRDAADARRGIAAERRDTAPGGPEDLDAKDPRRPSVPRASNEPLLVDRYRLPRSLEPTLMPEPWPVPRMRSALGLMARFTVAAAIAALVALFVVGNFPKSWLTAGKQESPSFGSRFSGQHAQTAEQPKPATAQLIPSKEASRGAGFSPAGESTTAAQPAASPAAQVPAGPTGQTQAAVSARAQASATERPQAGPTKSFVVRQLEREEIADLMRRGEAFIATGDFAS